MTTKNWMPKTAVSLLAMLLIAGCSTVPVSSNTNENAGAGAATEGWIRIVRGVNGGYCDAQAIGNGNNPSVKPTQDLTNLSISCSKKKADTVAQLRQYLPSPHICYSTLSDLRKSRKEVVVVRDPTGTNPYHCLLATITPNEFVSRSRYK